MTAQGPITRIPWLAHPLTRGMDIDAPATTQLRREIILQKPFLRHIYEDWYAFIASSLPAGPGAVLELGSGAGFLDRYIPEVVKSEVFPSPSIHVTADGQHLPVRSGALRGIVMVDVLHHLPSSRAFFQEAVRCLRPGGVIAMVEPWVTQWSRLVYQRLHYEPFHPEAREWEFPATGPLSGANGALPWIIFERDRAVFEDEFPCLSVRRVEPSLPLRYLLSGGVSLRSLMPGWSTHFWRALERAVEPASSRLAMFARILVVRGS